MNNIAYSHRPVAGISIGAVNKDGKLYFAAALTNSGLSLGGNYDPERHDIFSRKQARMIINGRLEKMMETADPSEQYHLGLCFETGMSGREFMQKMRPRFKPCPVESDDTFWYEVNVLGTEVTGRISPQEIWMLLANTANELVSGVQV